MPNTLQNLFASADCLLDQRDHEAALTALKSIRLRSVGDLTPADYSEYYYLYARCLLRRGDYNGALSRIRGALRLSQFTANHGLYAKEKHLLGLVYRTQGNLREATEAFLEALASRKRARDHEGLCSSLIGLALTHFASGDMKQANSVLDDALAYARQYNGEPEVRLCQLNRCLVAFFSGDFAEFRSIIDSIRAHPLGVLDTAHVAKHLGQLAVFMLDHETARDKLKEALVVYARSHIRREQAICLEFLGLNEYFAGNYKQAKEYYLRVLDMPEPTASAVAQTLRMLTDVYIAEGDFDMAMETAVKAEAAITKINERIELGALYRAYGQIYEHRSETERSRDYSIKSIDLLRLLGAKYELALSYFAAGRAKDFSESQCIEHLQQSRNLFVEMDVPKRIAQVDAAVSAISRPNCRPRATTVDAVVPEQAVIVTQNRRMRDILDLAERLKDTKHTILITGETGTGKDLLVEYIHGRSCRRDKPLVMTNSAAIPTDLFESELFGHRKGAFTGAQSDRVGMIASADGGTFFFNEIAEASLIVQAKLLTLLDTNRVKRVGADRDITIDVRFVAATNADLPDRVRSGLFRQDLYRRLSSFHLELPPLRERKDDIPLLVDYFLTKQDDAGMKLSADARQRLLQRLIDYDWPGNVRELRQIADRLAMMVSNANMEEVMAAVDDMICGTDVEAGEDPEHQLLIAALKRHSGNQTRVAEELKTNRTTLRYRMRCYGLL